MIVTYAVQPPTSGYPPWAYWGDASTTITPLAAITTPLRDDQARLWPLSREEMIAVLKMRLEALEGEA